MHDDDQINSHLGQRGLKGQRNAIEEREKNVKQFDGNILDFSGEITLSATESIQSNDFVGSVQKLVYNISTSIIGISKS